jgi:RES domain-containing protein
VGSFGVERPDDPARIASTRSPKEIQSLNATAIRNPRQRLVGEGIDGVIYPSFMSSGGSCVALWRWNEKDGARLEVIDPDHRMPKASASWL